MQNFTEIKQTILTSAKENRACSDEYKKALKSTNLSELCKVLKDNFSWVCIHNIITPELLTKYRSEFAENEIWINCDTVSGYLLAYDSSKVKAYGYSTVEAYGSSTVEAYDSSYISCHTDIQCKISDNVIIRRWNTNTIQYCDSEMKFEKVETQRK